MFLNLIHSPEAWHDSFEFYFVRYFGVRVFVVPFLEFAALQFAASFRRIMITPCCLARKNVLPRICSDFQFEHLENKATLASYLLACSV